MRSHLVIQASVCLVALSLSSKCHALPFFSVGDESDQSWIAALTGQIMLVTSDDGMTAASNAFFLNQGVIARLPVPGDFNANPSVDVPDFGGTSKSSLVASWELPPLEEYVVGGWEWVYDVDPDLTGTQLEFSVLNPVGTQHLSVELIDIDGKSRGWFLSVPPDPIIWTDYFIRPDEALQSPFEFFFDETGFDITRVVAIRLGSTAIESDPILQPNPVIGGLPTWNAWGHLSVVPEPSTLPGDYNFNLVVDAADYTVWANTFGQMGPNLPADGNGNLEVDAADYTIWANEFGNTAASPIPEPSTFVLSALGLISLLAYGWRRRRRA